MSELTQNYIIGSFTTLLGVIVTHLLLQYAKNKEDKALSVAVKALFITTLYSYKNYLLSSNPLPWKNIFWENHQFEIAKYFPAEASHFSYLLCMNNNDRNTTLISEIDKLARELRQKDK